MNWNEFFSSKRIWNEGTTFRDWISFAVCEINTQQLNGHTMHSIELNEENGEWKYEGEWEEEEWEGEEEGEEEEKRNNELNSETI